MPMIVFQQAKDMKLDPGLFFLSIIILYLIFDFYKERTDKVKMMSVKKSDFLEEKNLNEKNVHLIES